MEKRGNRVQHLRILLEMAKMSLYDFCEKMTAEKYDPFSSGVLLSILGDISNGMLYIHALNIAHRDMHLKNFLVCEDFTVKVKKRFLSLSFLYPSLALVFAFALTFTLALSLPSPSPLPLPLSLSSASPFP
jgi:serine/threonine protein kinase